jgi:prevent-host-death family protein
MPNVSVRELKNRLAHYLRLSEQGQRITVTRRGKPVAVISPTVNNGKQQPTTETQEERVRRKTLALVEKGVVSWSGEKPKLPTKRIKLRGKGPTVSEMILEDRR